MAAFDQQPAGREGRGRGKRNAENRPREKSQAGILLSAGALPLLTVRYPLPGGEEGPRFLA